MDMLYLLALLACPIGMGLMMWFMGRGHRGNDTQSTGNTQEQEIAQLRAEVAALRQQSATDDVRPG